MPSKNTEQIKIWKPAHAWLLQLSQAYKSAGQSSASMTALASQAILAIPMPNGHQPGVTNTNGEVGSDLTKEEKQ